MKIVSGMLLLGLLLSVSGTLLAQPGHGNQLPPGLAKKVESGKSLPPGWERKLAVGGTLDLDVYRAGKVVFRDGHGLVTIAVGGKLIRLVQDTREIVDIMESM